MGDGWVKCKRLFCFFCDISKTIQVFFSSLSRPIRKFFRTSFVKNLKNYFFSYFSKKISQKSGVRNFLDNSRFENARILSESVKEFFFIISVTLEKFLRLFCLNIEKS